MKVAAKLRYLRVAPRKVRLVADLIRGKKALEGQTLLRFTIKKPATSILKLLNSALSNAKHNFQLEEGNLFISKITVDEGPKLKRWMPRARGRVSEIQKKTSHVTLILDEIERKSKKIKKKPLRQAQGKQKLEKEEKEEIIAQKKEKPKLRPEKEVPKPKSTIRWGFNESSQSDFISPSSLLNS